VTKGRGEEANLDSPVSQLFSRTVLAVLKAFPAIPRVFWVYFVNLKIFNVVFV
jgi:hypothetical protein